MDRAPPRTAASKSVRPVDWPGPEASALRVRSRRRCEYSSMRRSSAGDKLMYTTGRLTSEMVIKCALMGIPVLASRSGFTAWGVEIARQVGLTLIGRMRGQRFVCLSGEERLVRDADLSAVPDEDGRHRRKGAAKA